jgi:hypothetical protein
MSVSMVVVAFRLGPATLQSNSDRMYLGRARSICARCELQGGRLVAWGDGSLAFGWPAERFDDIVGLVEKLRTAEPSQGPMWAVGVAEGEVDLLAPDGSAGHLAWGKALVGAFAMARAARLGEVVVDEEVRAYREGRLSTVGERTTMLGRHRVRGWRLDTREPWARQVDEDDTGDRTTLPYVEREEHASPPSESPAIDADAAETSASVVGSAAFEATEPLTDLRRARAGVQGSSPAIRCRASLELAMALGKARRCEDALLEALDALARGREADDPVAVAACMALLAKLYDMAGSRASAAALRDVALGR